MSKYTIIGLLIDYYVNPNWHGNKADDERVAWKKSLNKQLKKDLIQKLKDFETNLKFR